MYYDYEPAPIKDPLYDSEHFALTAKIKNTVKNRKALREHAKEAIADYSPLATWLALDDQGDLRLIVELQGGTFYCGSDPLLAKTGSASKAHGQGAAKDKYGKKYKTQTAYLRDFLGEDYARIFGE